MKLVKPLVMRLRGFLVGLASMSPGSLWLLAVFWHSSVPFYPILVPQQFWLRCCFFKWDPLLLLEGTFVSLSTIMKISLQVQSWFFKNLVFSCTLIPWKAHCKILASTYLYRIIVLLFLRPWGGFMNLISGQVCFYKVSCSTLNQT